MHQCGSVILYKQQQLLPFAQMQLVHYIYDIYICHETLLSAETLMSNAREATRLQLVTLAEHDIDVACYKNTVCHHT